jgi:hypothetical protein
VTSASHVQDSWWDRNFLRQTLYVVSWSTDRWPLSLRIHP